MREEFRPYRLFILACAGAVVCAGLFGANQPYLLLAYCLFILIAGLPHGAYDIYIIRALYPGKPFALALGGYLALIVLSVFFWLYAPSLFLVSFLLYSAYHFGDSDQPNASRLNKWAWGSAIIALPCATAPEAVGVLFAAIIGGADSHWLVAAFGYLALPAVFLSGVLKSAGKPARPIILGLLFGYTLACSVGGPLLGFACYFAFLHGPQHLKRWQQRLGHRSPILVYALSLLVLGVVAAAVLWAPQFSGSELDPTNSSMVRYTFVALAALTVPHMTFLFLASRKLPGTLHA